MALIAAGRSLRACAARTAATVAAADASIAVRNAFAVAAIAADASTLILFAGSSAWTAATATAAPVITTLSSRALWCAYFGGGYGHRRGVGLNRGGVLCWTGAGNGLRRAESPRRDRLRTAGTGAVQHRHQSSGPHRTRMPGQRRRHGEPKSAARRPRIECVRWRGHVLGEPECGDLKNPRRRQCGSPGARRTTCLASVEHHS